MNKLVSLLAVVIIFVMSASPSVAIQPFNQAFKDLYTKPETPFAKKVEDAKCNLCHDGKDRKKRNVYGIAVGNYLKKADFQGPTKKLDPKSDEGKKAVAEGLQKAGAEKSHQGKTFEELIKSGELPSPVMK